MAWINTQPEPRYAVGQTVLTTMKLRGENGYYETFTELLISDVRIFNDEIKYVKYTVEDKDGHEQLSVDECHLILPDEKEEYLKEIENESKYWKHQKIKDTALYTLILFSIIAVIAYGLYRFMG